MMPKARVKICGITSVSDALMVSAAGADAIGIVFYPPSPRFVEDLGLAREIAFAAGPFVTVVGLFVSPVLKDVERVLAQVPINVLQFHGNETPAECEYYKRPYIKALRMKPGVDIGALADLYTNASGILLDAYRKGVPGGTGEVFDWDEIPKNIKHPLILAGGLSPKNVREALGRVTPWAVDVSGGVEGSPGKKDRNLVEQFLVNAVR